MNALMFSMLVVLFGCASYDSSRHQSYISQAKILHQNSEWEESNKFLELLEQESILSDDLVGIKVKNFEYLSRPNDGRIVIDHAIARKPHSINFLVLLSNWLLDYGKKEDFLKINSLILTRNPNNLSAVKLLVKLYKRENQWGQIKDTLLVYDNKNILDNESQYCLAQAMYKFHDYEKAIAGFTRLYNQGVYQQQTAKYLGWIHAERKEIDLANIYIRKLTEVLPRDPLVKRLITKNLLNQSQTDKLAVLKMYNAEYEDDWGQHQYWLALKQSGQTEQALDYISDVLTRKNPKPWVVLAYSRDLRMIGQKEHSLAVLNKALPFMNGDARSQIQNEITLLTPVNIKQEEIILVNTEKSSNNLENQIPVLVPPTDNPIIEKTTEAKSLPENERGTASVKDVIYEVKAGDTLQTISQKFYKTTRRWPDILKANKDVLSSYDKIEKGTKLKISGVQ